ncbi:MAG: Sua5/YciO/YrdC/YwlC family protein [Gammaproteobacteria bacterium]|jgi:L-threonylcarbamoyladenylate synthase
MGDWHIKRAAAILHLGGIIAYPTEGVWGLGCDPTDAQAVLRLLMLKHRPWQKGLILIAADYEQLAPFVTATPALLKRVRATWPGPVTWLLPARDGTPPWLCGIHRSLAVRVTAHPVAAALCRRFGGALVSTSANLSGRPAARRQLQVRRYFGAGLDYIVPGPLGPQQGATEIRDAISGSVIRTA